MTTYSTKNTATTSYQSSTASNVWFCIRESLKRRTNSQHGVVLARFFKCWTRMAQDGWTCQILVFMGVMSLERIVGGWLKHTAGLKDRDAGGITLPYNIIIMNKSPFLVKTSKIWFPASGIKWLVPEKNRCIWWIAAKKKLMSVRSSC
jgi:hypothetical protein